MFLRSVAIPADSVIELRHAHTGVGGENLAPDLSWGDAPEGTRSFMVTCFDPDAPTGSGWWHWVAFDIPDDVTALDAGAELPAACRFNPLAHVLASASFTATFAVAG